MSVAEDIKLGLEQAIEYEKQVKEMAEILCESKEHNCNGEDCKCLKQATALFNKGARIIPKDSVVLTREEFWKLSNKFSKKELDDISQFRADKASKETAEKCRDFIKKWIGKDEEGLGFLFDFEDFIAKQFGVET